MASGTQELELFVREALARGCTREDVERAMLAAAWTQEQARSALGAYAATDFPVPVPRPRPYLSAREAFLYLVLFSTLYLSAYNFGSLLFDFINRAFPDPVVREFGEDRMRWSVASLIIAFPIDRPRERSRYCLSYIAVFLNFLPCGSVPLVVTVRLLPSADTTIRPLTVTLPSFLTVNARVRSSIFLYDRASEVGSPVTG